MPSTLRLEGVNARLDLSAAVDDLSGLGADRTAAPKRSTDQRSLGADDIDIHVRDARVEVVGLPTLMEPAALDGASALIRREGGRWRASFRGSCASGCGGARAVDGELEEGSEGWRASARMDQPVEIVAPLKGRAVPISLEGVAISSGTNGFRVEAQGVRATQEIGGWRLNAQISAVRSTLDGLKLGPIELDQPQVVATRAPSPARDGAAVGVDPAGDAGPADDIDAPADEGRPSSPSGRDSRRGRREKGAKGPTAALKGGAGEGGMVAALLDVEGFGRRRDAVIEALGGISARGGVLEIEGERIEEIEAAAEGGKALVSGRWRGGAASVRVERGVDGVDVALEGFDLGALAQRVRPGGAKAAAALSGDVRVRLGPAGSPGVRLEVEGVIDRGEVLIPAVAVAAIAVKGASLDLEASYTPPGPRGARDRVKVERLELGLASRRGGVVRVEVNGEVEGLSGGRPPIVRLEVEVEEVECDLALNALPEALVPNLIGAIEASGRFAPRLDVSVDMRDPEGLSLRLTGLPGSCRIESLGPHDPAWLNDAFEREVREGVSRAGIKVGPATEGYVKLGAMPAYVGAAAYLSEEANFRTNKGFDLGLMRRAVRTNLKEGRYVYGGSSVSQQLVKNLFLAREKTLSRKLEEALIVWKMESIVSKDRILELYLNCIEFGPDLYGIGPASWLYFGKPASRLSPLEGSFLAAIKPAPWFGERFRKNGRTPSQGWWQSRLEYIMGRLHEKGFIPAEALTEAEPYVVRFR